jgi:hypothetical protein
MTYLSAIQVKNTLAKYGIKRGKKSSYAKLTYEGVTTTNLGDGWVWVEFSDAKQAVKENVDSASYNHSMGEIIHFILTDMNQFEFRKEITGQLNNRHNYFYRKAV